MNVDVIYVRWVKLIHVSTCLCVIVFSNILSSAMAFVQWISSINKPKRSQANSKLHNKIELLILWIYFVDVQSLSHINCLQPHGLQHVRIPCPSPTPGACSNSCPLSQWCHPTISSSAVPFSSCLQSFPVSGSFLKSWLSKLGGQSIGASASVSVLLMNTQDWFLLGLTGLISLQSKGLSRVFSNTTVQKHQFFSIQPSLVLNFLYSPTLTSIHDYCKTHSLD